MLADRPAVAYVRGYSYADVAVGAIFRRSIRLARAIITLARTGCGADALALSRSLIDCWLALRWITNQDSETRGKLFWGFGAKQKERMADMVNAYRSTAGSDQVTLDPEIQSMAANYRRWDSWGPGTRAMADEPELLTPDAWLNMKPSWAYEVPFFFSSCYLHPTAIGLRHEAPDRGGLFSFARKEDEESEAESALVATAAIIAHLGNRVSVFWGLGLSDEIKQVWDKKIGRLIK